MGSLNRSFLTVSRRVRAAATTRSEISPSPVLAPIFLAMLDPSPDEIRDWGKSAIDLIAEYLGGIRERRVYPQTSSREIREQLDATLPRDGTNLDELFATFRDVLI